MYNESEIEKIQILPDLYELPHLFGLWISDPELLALKEEITGNIWSPKLYMFVGTLQGFDCDIFPTEEDEDVFKTEFIQFQHGIENTEFALQHFQDDGDGETEYLRVIDMEWGLSNDGRLNLTYDNDTRRFVTTSFEAAAEIGFDADLLREIADVFIERDRFFKETFDLNTAYELIDAKLSKQEDEEGMERGFLGRPDPTTWVFGDDRYTGPVPPMVGKG